ncbi:MAG: glycosyltransferase family 2 protein [Cyanobacteria bacterium SZAS-4]|nr:glycosyltransferase family 2 protein [Cyanobacteria bacterium SZAS-4]
MRKPRVKVSIVIPAYNEESRLPHTLMKTATFLAKQAYSSEIIVVTDGSTDGTERVVEVAAARYGGIRLISLPKNRGKGFSVKYGMINALGDYRLFMDADYAVPIEYLNEFLAEIERGGDVIIGSRSHHDTQIGTPQGFPRRQLAITFGYLQRAILRMPFLDTQCGFKLFTADAVKLLFPHVVYECAYFDAELLYVATKMGLNVKEIGVRWTHDQQTRLPIGVNRSIDLFRKMIAIPSIHADKQPVSRTRQFALEDAL